MLYRKIHTKPKSKNYEPRAAIIYLLIMRHILFDYFLNYAAQFLSEKLFNYRLLNAYLELTSRSNTLPWNILVTLENINAH